MSGADIGKGQQEKDADKLATQKTGQSQEREPFLVLIAEDEEPIAEAIAMLVEDCGYTPLTASNGRQALELARRRQPALIITDLMMPYLDGDELIATLKSDAARDGYRAPPVILLSAAGLRRVNRRRQRWLAGKETAPPWSWRWRVSWVCARTGYSRAHWPAPRPVPRW